MNWVKWFFKIMSFKYWLVLITFLLSSFFWLLWYLEPTSNYGQTAFYFMMGITLTIIDVFLIVALDGNDAQKFFEEQKSKIIKYYSNWWKDRPNG